MVVKGRGVDGVGGGGGGDGDLGLEWIKSKTNESWTSVFYLLIFCVKNHCLWKKTISLDIFNLVDCKSHKSEI